MLFSIGLGDVAPIQAAAEAAGCVLTNKCRYAELYSDQPPKMLEFAREVRRRLLAAEWF